MKLDKNNSKELVFETIAEFISKEDFSVVSKDQNRPWGGFFVIDESQAPEFIKRFF